MAVNHDDRVSSARLLDMLKGLQENRHLGSEPKVETETVEYPAVVSPAPGTYQTAEEINATMSQEPDENRFPIKVYTTVAVPADGTFPFTVNEPSGDYVEITKKVTVNGGTIYCQADFPDDGDVSSYTGYIIGKNQGAGGIIWTAVHTVNGSGNLDVYQWEMPAKTETITTKTKHTIKQDYVPNADWNQNDPDGEGYVEGRTHWVETGENGITVNVQSGIVEGNFAMGTCDDFGAVKGFTYPTGEYNPGRTGEIVEFEENGQTMAFSYIGEDENGNAIIPTNMAELMTALSTTNIGIMLLKQNNDSMAYVAYPNATTGDVCTATVDYEIIHKLDSMFYDKSDLSLIARSGIQFIEKAMYDTDDVTYLYALYSDGISGQYNQNNQNTVKLFKHAYYYQAAQSINPDMTNLNNAEIRVANLINTIGYEKFIDMLWLSNTAISLDNPRTAPYIPSSLYYPTETPRQWKLSNGTYTMRYNQTTDGIQLIKDGTSNAYNFGILVCNSGLSIQNVISQQDVNIYEVNKSENNTIKNLTLGLNKAVLTLTGDTISASGQIMAVTNNLGAASFSRAVSFLMNRIGAVITPVMYLTDSTSELGVAVIEYNGGYLRGIPINPPADYTDFIFYKGTIEFPYEKTVYRYNPTPH